MKCKECLPLLELYADGELPAREAEEVAAHLSACAPCSASHARLLEEQELYLRYECEPAESPAFWDEVLANMRAEKSRRPEARPAQPRSRLASLFDALSAPRFSPTLTAALLLVAIGVTAALMRYFGPREGTPQQTVEARKEGGEVSLPTNPTNPTAEGVQREQEVARADVHDREVPAARVRALKAGGVEMKRTREARPSSPSVDDSDRLVREAEQKYLAAIHILSRDVGRRRTRMDADTLARFERTLGVIDKSIAETRAAARTHPRDPVAVQYMLAAYAKKVEVLRDMAQD